MLPRAPVTVPPCHRAGRRRLQFRRAAARGGVRRAARGLGCRDGDRSDAAERRCETGWVRPYSAAAAAASERGRERPAASESLSPAARPATMQKMTRRDQDRTRAAAALSAPAAATAARQRQSLSLG